MFVNSKRSNKEGLLAIVAVICKRSSGLQFQWIIYSLCLIKPLKFAFLRIKVLRFSRLPDMVTRRNVRYSPLPTDEDNFIATSLDRPSDPRFDFTPKALDRVPWKSIALALFLLFLGTTLLVISFFVFTGHMGGERSQAYGFLVLGILSFLPGFYETRTAYYAWRGAKGYSFSAIPAY